MAQETTEMLEREETATPDSEQPQSEAGAQEPEEEDELGALRHALQEREEHIAALETELRGLQEALARREEELAAAQGQVEDVRGQLAIALEHYRASLLASAPEVPEELVSGETVEALEASFQAALGMVERVRSRLEAKLGRERVPPGAPTRSGPELSSLSPREKILRALTRR